MVCNKLITAQYARFVCTHSASLVSLFRVQTPKLRSQLAEVNRPLELSAAALISPLLPATPTLSVQLRAIQHIH